MNSQQRSEVRNALRDLGFHRQQYSDDIAGTGVYEEVFFNGTDVVTINWGKRDADAAPRAPKEPVLNPDGTVHEWREVDAS